MSSNPNGNPSAGESEDLFDFASAENPPAATHADELDVDAFLSAVGDLAEEETEQDSIPVTVSDDLRGTLIGSDSELLEQESASAQPHRGSSRSQNRSTVALDPGTPLLIGLPWPVLVGGGILIALNAWLVFTLWTGQSKSGEDLKESVRELERTAESVADRIDQRVDRIERTTLPSAAPTPDTTTSLAHVERSLELGDHALARRQVYALLSIIDRLPTERRRDTEARAQFLLARIDRLEAQDRRTPGRPESSEFGGSR